MILHVGANVENVALCWGIVETGLLTWIQVCYPGTVFCNLSQFWLLTELSIYNTLLRYLHFIPCATRCTIESLLCV